MWNSFVNTIYVISFMLIPTVIGTQGHFLDAVQWVELVFDFIMLMDIILAFFTAYYSDVELVRSMRGIALHYVFGYFIFDVIGVVPGLVTAEFFFSIYFLKCFRYL